ncbi:hypothetical protein Tco_1542659, partial [Tanacetum coccineum]
KAQQLEPTLYDGNVIKNTSVIVIPDSEETLILAEDSCSKMLLKQKDPIMLEKKVITTPVDYANSVNSLDPTISSRPTKVEVPKELPKVNMVNTNLKKLKHHLTGFDVVVKERTTTTTITKGSLQISQSPRGIFINQSKYVLESLRKYGMESSDPVDTLIVEKSKLDEQGKAIDPYILLWNAYTNADHTGCKDTRRSTSGFMQLLGDRLVSWSSKRQKSAAISSTEAEYIALSSCFAQVLWMRS